MNSLAVIVAGGRSTRMGKEKVFQLVRGRSILSRILSCLRPQVQHIVINANGDAERFREAGLLTIADLRSDVASPLAGIHTALSFAQQNRFGAVLTVPSDTPFLPSDLVYRLAAAGRTAAIASAGGQQHYVTGLWSPDLLPLLEQALDEPRTPRLQDWARKCDAAVVTWPIEPYDPFFNVNTPEELAEAERIAAEFAP